MEKITIRKNNNWSKKKFEVIFPNNNVQRFSTIFQARKFALDNVNDTQKIVENEFETTPRPIKNFRWQ